MNEPTTAEMRDSILAYYRGDVAQMYAAHGWYTLAQRSARRIARTHGVTVRTAAGVIAAMSPMNAWGSNLQAAERILAAWADGRPMPERVGLTANVRKAWAIAGGERPLDVLSGPKVRAFYRNMTGDLDAVTIDRWAARAAGVPDNYGASQRRYDAVSEAYRAAAEVVGLEPAILQAIIWCSIRGKAE